jgi:hypothetical protein
MKTIMVERRSRVNPEGANAGKEEGSGFGVQKFRFEVGGHLLQPSAVSRQPSSFSLHHSSFSILYSAFCISPAHSTITVSPR